jgi:hypothetical protein
MVKQTGREILALAGGMTVLALLLAGCRTTDTYRESTTPGGFREASNRETLSLEEFQREVAPHTLGGAGGGGGIPGQERFLESAKGRQWVALKSIPDRAVVAPLSNGQAFNFKLERHLAVWIGASEGAPPFQRYRDEIVLAPRPGQQVGYACALQVDASLADRDDAGVLVAGAAGMNAPEGTTFVALTGWLVPALSASTSTKADSLVDYCEAWAEGSSAEVDMNALVVAQLRARAAAWTTIPKDIPCLTYAGDPRCEALTMPEAGNKTRLRCVSVPLPDPLTGNTVNRLACRMRGLKGAPCLTDRAGNVPAWTCERGLSCSRQVEGKYPLRRFVGTCRD